MTRFARAKGSKASNERLPEEATSWSEIKQQLLDQKKIVEENKHRQEFVKLRQANYNAFLEEVEQETKETKWAEFPGVTKAVNKQGKPTNITDKTLTLTLNTEEDFTPLKTKFDTKRITDSDSDAPPEEKSAKEIPVEVVFKKAKKKKLLKVVVDKEEKQNQTNNLLKAKRKAETIEEEVKNKLIKVVEETKVLTEKELRKIEKKKQRRQRQVEKKKLRKELEKSLQNNDGKEEQKQNDITEINKQKTGKKKNGMLKNKTLTNQKVKNENLNEEDIQKIEKKKQKKLKQLEKRKKFKELKLQQQLEQDNANATDGNNETSVHLNNFEKQKEYQEKTILVKPDRKTFKNQEKTKFRDNKEHVRRKFRPDKMMINGKDIEIGYVEGFPVKKEDFERLQKLRKQMIGKGLPRSEINAALKLERRKAEKALAREKKNVCFNCRQSGHNLSECPELNKNQVTQSAGTGICFKCGSTEHTHFECKVVRGLEYKFAQCFICNEQGHIARQCPDNSRGLYPKGGACKVCGDVTHLKKDCPKFQEQQQHLQTRNHLETLDNRNPDILERDESESKQIVNRKPNKIVKF